LHAEIVQPAKPVEVAAPREEAVELRVGGVDLQPPLLSLQQPQ